MHENRAKQNNGKLCTLACRPVARVQLAESVPCGTMTFAPNTVYIIIAWCAKICKNQ